MADGKFVAYYRVSTAKQGASGLGLEAQQKAVEDWLNGGSWKLIAAYTDVETGTRKGNHRPELMKAMAQCKRDKATLVIAKLDRLARNVAFVAQLMESGVDFIATDMPMANKLTIHILAAVAEHEAEMISRRTKDALAAARARGVKLGSPDNLTHEAREKGAAVRKMNAQQAYGHLAPKILALYHHGKSLGEIARILTNSGEFTRNGSKFTAMTIKRIIDRQL